MVIVGGTYEVDPGERAAFLDSRHDVMRRSRAEDGCLEYTFAADPLDPGRVILFERWTSREALDAHLDALRARQPEGSGEGPAASMAITIYDVAAEHPVEP